MLELRSSNTSPSTCNLLLSYSSCFVSGVKVLFKVAVVLFRYGLGNSEQVKQYSDLHGIVTRLKNLPPHIMEEDFLVNKV